MLKVFMAIYENGILRPLQPLDLKEGQTVRVRVLSVEAGMKQTKLFSR
jgi:predicted DNA-binding antitoxin AbrB/MazE fold protein